MLSVRDIVGAGDHPNHLLICLGFVLFGLQGFDKHLHHKPGGSGHFFIVESSGAIKYGDFVPFRVAEILPENRCDFRTVLRTGTDTENNQFFILPLIQIALEPAELADSAGACSASVNNCVKGGHILLFCL